MGCTGCALFSPDPARNHCYAATLINRYQGRKGWPSSFTEPEVFDHRIPQALNWSDLTGENRPDKPWLNGYPRIVFVNDLSDGFCPDVDPHEWLTPHLERMAKSPHIWLLLTKWPERMSWYFNKEVGEVPRNFWLGTTVTGPSDEWRVRVLMDVSWGVTTWISVEPLLGPLDIGRLFVPWGESPFPSWVAAGGESGANARPTHPEWALSLRDQCQEAGVPFLWKQWGTWLPYPGEGVYGSGWSDDELEEYPSTWLTNAGEQLDGFLGGSSTHKMFNVGKKVSGRVLDGRLWNGMPNWGKR
jgi:protein gp37